MNPALRRIACLLGVLGLIVLLACVPRPAPVSAQAAKTTKAEFKLKLLGMSERTEALDAE